MGKIVYFKQPFLVKDLELPNLESCNFDYGENNSITITLRQATEEERTVGKEIYRGMFCLLQAKKEPNEKLYFMFENLAEHKIPQFNKIKKQVQEDWKWEDVIDSEGRFKENHLLPISFMPTELKEYLDNTRNEITNYLDATIAVLRWRLNLEGPYQPILGRDITWSFSLDDQNWQHLPIDILGYSSIIEHPTLTKELFDEVETRVQSGQTEPFYHQLWREAWELKSNNPRSALVIGMAAAEVGFKEYVAALVPDSQWLVENLPSPPINKMLKNYFPKLPARLKIKDFDPSIPNSIQKKITEGMELRNKIVHSKSVRPDNQQIYDILCSIRDLLLILDYHQGYEWTLRGLTTDIQDEFGLPLPRIRIVKNNNQSTKKSPK